MLVNLGGRYLQEFIATTYDDQGKKNIRRQMANNETEVIKMLAAEHLIVQRIRTSRKIKLQVTRSPQSNFSQLILFTRQLAALLAAGIHLGPALHILSEQAKTGPWQEALRRIEMEVMEGKSLSQAMQGQSTYFSTLYTSLIQVGETGGALTDVLAELTKYLEREQAWRAKLREAAVYPAIVMGVAFFAVILLMVQVIPTFADMFADVGLSLPLITRGLIGLSVFLTEYGIFLLMGLLLSAIGFRWWSASPSGKLIWQRKLFQLPVVGRIFYRMVIGRMTFSLALLIRTGIPLLRALEVTMGVVNYALVEQMLAETAKQIINGKNLSQTFIESAILDAAAIHMIAVGEETGALEQMFSGLSDLYDTELQHSLTSLLAMAEPVLILIVGLIVGLIVIAALLPMFDFMQSI